MVNETHLQEARIRLFAATAITFSQDENAHFDVCAECRVKTTQLLRIQFFIDRLQTAEEFVMQSPSADIHSSDYFRSPGRRYTQ